MFGSLTRVVSRQALHIRALPSLARSQIKVANPNQIFRTSSFLLQARAYSRPSPPQIIEKPTLELLDLGTQMVLQEDFTSAVGPLLRAYLQEGNKQPHGALVWADINMNLAFAYHQLKEHKQAKDHYAQALKGFQGLPYLGPHVQQHAATHVNYAELLVLDNRVDDAIKSVTKGIMLLRDSNDNSSTLLGAALSNLATYYCNQQKYSEARRPCSEALRIFIRDLGRHSDHTRSCFTTMYQIYRKLNLAEELADLEADWQTVDPVEVERLKGLTNNEIETLGEEVESSITMVDRKQEKEKSEKWFQKAKDHLEKGTPIPEDEKPKEAPQEEQLQFNDFFGTYGSDAVNRINKETFAQAHQAADSLPEDEELLHSGEEEAGEDDDEEGPDGIFDEDFEGQKTEENNWRIFPRTHS